MLKQDFIDTPLGTMVALASEKELYLLEFTDQPNLKDKIAKIGLPITPGSSPPIDSIKKELNGYFTKKQDSFNTPLFYLGSSFQIKVWKTLREIPFGKTYSYKELAIAIGKPTACRAVAGANGANPFTILIPCHRVINQNGKLGGYSAGLPRKEWLLHHETL